MRPLAAAFVLLAALPATAFAHGTAPRPMETTLSDLPPGPVKRALLDVRAAAAKADVDPALLDRPVNQALRAMERGRNARAAGDVRHAAMLENVAGEWTKMAETLLKAAIAEKAAAQVAASAREQGEKLQRTQVLLGEQQARRGRLQAELRAQEERVAHDKQQSAEREKERTTPKKKPIQAPKRGHGR